MKQYFIFFISILYCISVSVGQKLNQLPGKQGYIADIAPTCNLYNARNEYEDDVVTAGSDSSVTKVIASLHDHDYQHNDEGSLSDFAMLGAYRDFFSQASDFSLSMVRYRARGYENRYGEYRWNGILIQDWWRGSISWNLIGPLTSIPDRSFSSRGLISPAGSTEEMFGVSGTGGTSHVTSFPGELRAGGKVAWSSSSRTYTNRATAGYNTAISNKGWGFAAEATRRWGRSLTIDGTFADTWGFFASLYKKFEEDNFLNLTILFAPTERGVQSASTAEAFSLTGNNLYNPNWGMQSGQQRTARIRTSRQPIAILNHEVRISPGTVLRNALSIRGGREGYSALNWQNAENPYPDYYCKMPSFQTNSETAELIARMWREDVDTQQIDFEGLFEHNRNAGPRAHYIAENRIRKIIEGTIQTSIFSTIGNTTINGGIELFAGRTRKYKKVKDLMGGKYWLDTDQFVEFDDDYKELTQNDIRNPDRQVKVGDKFGYDYALAMRQASAWLRIDRKIGNFRLGASGAVTGKSYHREGFYEKENFAGNESFGKSPESNHLDYILKAEAEYRKGGRFRLAAAIATQSMSPSPQYLFISQEYRNALIPGINNESILSGEITAEYRSPLFRASGTVYGTIMRNRTELLSFYDDMERFYCHYLLGGIDTRYMGVEISGEIMIADPLWLSAAAAISSNLYESSPVATQWQEVSGKKIRTEKVYYKGLHISGSPQTVGVVSLSYRPRNWIVSLSLNGFDNSYISPAPLRRTIRALQESGSQEARDEAMEQEKFAGGITVDLFVGKSVYFLNGSSLGIYSGVNNIGNNKDIKSGGYEASRLRYVTTGSGSEKHLRPMDSKYYHALGINFFVNVTYRF